MFKLCPQIVPNTNNSVTKKLLMNNNTATLNKKCVAVTARYRQLRPQIQTCCSIQCLPCRTISCTNRFRSKRNLRVSRLSSTRALSPSAYDRPLILLIRFVKARCADLILFTAPTRYGDKCWRRTLILDGRML